MSPTLSELEHVHQTGQTATASSQEFPLKDLLGCGPHADVNRKALTEKDLQLSAQAIRILESGSAVGGNEEERFQRLFVEVWRFRFDHFNGHDAERPHVHFGVVLFLLDHFGGHPVWCADHGSALGFLVGQFGAESKVG